MNLLEKEQKMCIYPRYHTSINNTHTYACIIYAFKTTSLPEYLIKFFVIGRHNTYNMQQSNNLYFHLFIINILK